VTDDCVIEVGHRDARTRRAVWRDANAPHVIVCDRHRRQYEERPDLGPFAWEPIFTPAEPEQTPKANAPQDGAR
jgi:hypothetical protein